MGIFQSMGQKILCPFVHIRPKKRGLEPETFALLYYCTICIIAAWEHRSLNLTINKLPQYKGLSLQTWAPVSLSSIEGKSSMRKDLVSYISDGCIYELNFALLKS